MPPIARAGGGGVTKTPMGAKPDPAAQKGFFRAVAGTRSPLNDQSSRIPKPFAVNQYLGGGNVPTVSTPAQQNQLAASLTATKNVPAPAKRAALTIQQEYVKGADTKPGGSGPGPAGLPGAAVTGADPLAVAQRGLALMATGQSLGHAAPFLVHALAQIGLPNDQKQQVIAGFSKDKALDQPYTRGMLVAEAMAKGYGIPAHATTAQLLDDALAHGQHHSLGDIINPINIAKDAFLTPVFTAEGGLAIGHAVRAALPTAIGGGGNTSELAAIGKSQLQQIEHPLLTAEENPFQTALAVATGFKGVGKVVGKVAGLEATPRIIPINPEVSSKPGAHLDRGDYSTNAYDWLGQKVVDKTIGSSLNLQWRALENETRKAGNLETNRAARETKPLETSMRVTSAPLSRSHRSSLLANEGSGITAQEWADHYNQQATHNESIAQAIGGAQGKAHLRLAKTQRQQATVRQAQADKFGTLDNPTPRYAGKVDQAQAFLDAHRNASDTRTSTAVNENWLNQTNGLWRDYQHNIEVRAHQGNERAIAVRQARNALDELPGTKTAKGWVPHDPEAYQVAHDRLASTLDHYIMHESGIHGPGIHDVAPDVAVANLRPFRVPTHELRGKPPGGRVFGRGKSLPARTNARTGISHLQHSSGASLESGNYLTRPEDFTQQIIEPHRAMAGARFANRLAERFGRPGNVGEDAAPHESWVPVDNLRGGPRGRIDAGPSLEEHAAQLQGLKDDFKAALDTSASDKRYPGTKPGQYIAMPNPVLEQVAKTLDRVKPTKLHKVTRAFKKSVLYTRVAYPASNFLNSGAQAVLAGTSMGAIRHRNLIEHPDDLIGHGFMGGAYLPNEGRAPGVRSALEEANFADGYHQKAWAILKGAGRSASAVPHAIRDISVGADDFWRKAVYAQKAYADARKIAFPNEGRVSRLLRHRSIADKAILDAYHTIAHAPEGTAVARARARAMKATVDFLGDFQNMKRHDALDLAMPFNSWTRFSAKLLLQTLPLKYPGRTALLYKISQLGQQGSAQQGVLPQYLQESIPLGGSNEERYAAYTTRANPFGTLGSAMAPIQPGTVAGRFAGAPNFAGIIGSGLNPVLQTGANAIGGVDIAQGGRTLRDANGNAIFGNPVDIARYVGAQVVGTIPPLVALAGGTRGHADTSLPFISEQSRSTPAKPPLGGPQPAGPMVDILGHKFAILPIINQFSPIRIDERNLTADQIKGYKAMETMLRRQATKGPDGVALKNGPTDPNYAGALMRALTSANKLAGQIGYVMNDAAARKVQEQGSPGK